MSAMLGQMQLVYHTDLEEEELPPSITKDQIRHAFQTRNKEAQNLIEVLSYFGLKRIYSNIQSFIEGESYLNGTMGMPANVPDYLKYIAEAITDKQIENTRFYLMIPYSDRYLRTEALVDYIDVCRDWE
jgi:hypothetical protein